MTGLRLFVLGMAITVALLAGPPPARAQEGDAAPPPPCSSKEVSQFDFWIGEWNLTWADTGKGTNTIRRVLDDCVVLENFDSTPVAALKGWSVSTFDVRVGNWKQTWVDNQGGYLDFVGGMEGDRMILSRTAENEGQKIHQRMVWYDIHHDQFDWNWERSTDGGKEWQVLWKIHYVRKSDG